MPGCLWRGDFLHLLESQRTGNPESTVLSGAESAGRDTLDYRDGESGIAAVTPVLLGAGWSNNMKCAGALQ